MECTIPAEQPILQKLHVRKENLKETDLETSVFEKKKFKKNGKIELKKRNRQKNPLSLSEKQLHQLSGDFLRNKGGGLPSDAEPVGLISKNVLEFDPEDESGQSKNQYVDRYVIKYEHKYNGIEIVGGMKGDCIAVTIENSEVAGMRRQWREVAGPAGDKQQVVSAQEALKVAIENIPKIISQNPAGEYRITNIRLYYYGLPSEEEHQYLTPVWGFEVNDSMRVYVNAFTGEFIF